MEAFVVPEEDGGFRRSGDTSNEETPVVPIFNGVNYSRQMDIFNPFEHKDTKFLVIGAGAVGSYCVLTLAKMGFRNFEVWDHDVVSAENLPNQFYAQHQVGMKKVDALKELVKMFTGVDIVAVPKKVTEKTKFDGNYEFCITALDNMRTRGIVVELLRCSAAIFIDPRMGGLNFRVFTSNSVYHHDIPMYSDDQAVADPCTAKSIIFNVQSIASVVARVVLQWLRYRNRFDYDNNRQCLLPPAEIIGDLEMIRVGTLQDIEKMMMPAKNAVAENV